MVFRIAYQSPDPVLETIDPVLDRGSCCDSILSLTCVK